MDNLRIEIFTPREKRAAAALTVAVLLLAGSVFYAVQPAARPAPTGAPQAAGHTLPPAPWASFWFISPTLAFATAGTQEAILDAAAYRSSDGGSSWGKLPLPPRTRGVALLDPLPAGWLLLTATAIPPGFASSAHWLSQDGGATWRAFPLPATAGYGVLRLLDARTGVLMSRPPYLSEGGSPLTIYWTHDGGASWQQTLALDDAHPAAGALRITSPYLTPIFADDRRGWTMSGSFVPRAGVERPVLLRTTDAGHSWSEVALPPPPDRTFALNAPVFPNGGSHGYLALQAPSGLVLYESTDGGDRWSEPYMAPVAWFSVSADRWVSSEGRTLRSSRDWGRNWSSVTGRLPSPYLLLGRVEAAGPVLWSYHDGTSTTDTTADPGVLLRSTDGGRNWTQVRWPGA